MREEALTSYRILKKACLLEEPQLNSILSEIPVEWANNYELADIVTIVNIVKHNRTKEAIRRLSCFV